MPPRRLGWIHDVLGQAAAAGSRLLAVPRTTRSGESWVTREDCLWELAPWLPGEAGRTGKATPERVAAAASALAELHRHLGIVPIAAPGPVASGISARLERARELESGRARQIQAAIRGCGVLPDLAHKVGLMYERHGERIRIQLESASRIVVNQQVCLRDVRHAHLLFEGNRVTGVVDYGAMAVDCIAADVARLIGSMAGRDQQLWQTGLAAYREIRPLSTAEEALIEVYDVSGILYGAVNWIEWIFLHGRHFEDQPGIVNRLREMLHRMNIWC